MRNQQLRAAIERRGARAYQTREVCRLVAGASDHLDGLVIDRLGDFAFATFAQERLPIEREDLIALLVQLNLRGLTLRQRQKGGKGSSLIQLGDPLPERIVLNEGAARVVLRVHPESLSYGLFPDLRYERLKVGACAQFKSVLNLYAYSGIFGIHAALSGAQRVVQVDALKSTLAMIRANEEANHVQTTRLCEDALRYCQRASHRQEFFDLVIHDPPTFGRTPKGKARSLKQSLVELLSASMSVVRSGGQLLSVVNTASLSKKFVLEAHQKAAINANVKLRLDRTIHVDPTAPSPLKGGWYTLRR